MYISELIDKLIDIRSKQGEILVTAEDNVGEFNIDDCYTAYDPDNDILSANLILLAKY